MRLFLLIALTMVAFAANSVLNRAALAGGEIDAVSFGTIRLWSGAVSLALLGGCAGRMAGVLGLYIYGFSVAYVALDAGPGALILFGTVQVTMFGGSLIGGERPLALRWAGAALAFGGLAWLLWPGGGRRRTQPATRRGNGPGRAGGSILWPDGGPKTLCWQPGRISCWRRRLGSCWGWSCLSGPRRSHRTCRASCWQWSRAL